MLFSSINEKEKGKKRETERKGERQLSKSDGYARERERIKRNERGASGG